MAGPSSQGRPLLRASVAHEQPTEKNTSEEAREVPQVLQIPVRDA